MGVSRDEAREIAITALLIVTVLRVGAGFVQAFEELGREWTLSSVVGRVLAPVGSTIGMYALAASLIAALSPRGSVSPRVVAWCRLASGGVAMLGLASVLNGLSVSISPLSTRLWFAMINGFAAAVLAGAGWWILRNLDTDR